MGRLNRIVNKIVRGYEGESKTNLESKQYVINNQIIDKCMLCNS